MNTPSTGLPESIASAAQHASSLRGRAGRSAGRSLAKVLFDEFESKIRQGLLREGDKLPTESELVQGYDVSRTVVREALSKLQAAGLAGSYDLQRIEARIAGLEQSVSATLNILSQLLEAVRRDEPATDKTQ